MKHYHVDDVWGGYCVSRTATRAYATREQAREAAQKLVEQYRAQGLDVEQESPDRWWVGLWSRPFNRPVGQPVEVVECKRTDIVGLDF